VNVDDGVPEPGFGGIDDELCRSFQAHLEVVGRRWNAGILLASVRGALRFSEYRAMIPGISDRLLAQRLRELEAEGLIERTVVPTSPVLVHYRPSRWGRELLQILQPLIFWSHEDNKAASSGTRR
jgi:DNA-binding HxlR family transcriptional regulator